MLCEFHFWFTFFCSHKSQGGPWLFSHKVLRMLNPSHQGLEHRTYPPKHTPPIRSSLSTYNWVANSPEETLRLRETWQGCYPDAFKKNFPGRHQTLFLMPTKGRATRDATAGEKAFFGSWHLHFAAAECALWVVGAIGFPSAADETAGR